MIALIPTLISAMLYIFPFLMPFYCAEGIFLFLIPLLYNVYRNHYPFSFLHGYVWGLCVYSSIFYDVLHFIATKGHGLARIVAIIFILNYVAIACGLWFYVSVKSVYMITQEPAVRLYTWCGSTWLFFYLVDTYFFIIFGASSGNTLMSPLLPLAIRPQWLFFLSWLTKNGYVLCMFLLSTTAVVLLYKKTLKIFLLFFLLLLALSAGWFFNKKDNNIKFTFEYIACLIPSGRIDNNFLLAEHIMNKLHEIKSMFPSATYIIMPESSYPFALNEYPLALRMWNDTKNLLIGSHRSQNGALFNTLYHIKHGVITNYYDKKNRLFFAEYIPPLFSSFASARSLLLKNLHAFSESLQPATSFTIDKKTVQPFICSDLIFEKHIHDIPIWLCIMNDSWSKSSIISQLMFLHAKVCALALRSTVIYISHRYWHVVYPSGACHELPHMKV